MKKILSLLLLLVSISSQAQIQRSVNFNFNEPQTLNPSVPKITEVYQGTGVCGMVFKADNIKLIPTSTEGGQSVAINTQSTSTNRLGVYEQGRLEICSDVDRIVKIQLYGANSVALLDGPTESYSFGIWTDYLYSEPQYSVKFRGSNQYSYLDSIVVTYVVTEDVINPVSSSIAEGQTINYFKADTLTFGRNIKLVKGANFTLNDASGSKYPLTAKVDGTRLILSADSLATAGTYSFTIPEKTIYAADDDLLYNKEYSLSFSIAEKENIFFVKSTEPATETMMNSIPEKIVVTFQGSVGGIVDTGKKIAIYNETDLAKPLAYFTAEQTKLEQVTLTTKFPIEDSGVYDIVLPEGMFYDVNYDEKSADHGVSENNAKYNPETVLRYFVKADPTNCTDSIKNADLSTTDAWDTTNTKGISDGQCKVSSGKDFDFSQTINLKAGQYKLTAQAAYRYGGDEQSEYDAITAGEKTHIAKLYAQTETYKYRADVKNRWEGATDAVLDGCDAAKMSTVNGKYVPNSSDNVLIYMKAGQYDNELIFNVQTDGQVKIGIVKKTSPAVGDYANIAAWKLVRIGDAEPDPEPVPAASDSIIAVADSLLAFKGVGYPKADAEARVALEALRADLESTDEQYEVANKNFYESTDIELPSDTTYTIANVAKDGSKLYLSEVDGKIVLTENAADACVFYAKTAEGKTTFLTADSLYLHTLVNTDTYEGTSKANLTKDSTSICNITVAKLAVEGVKTTDIFGYVSLFGEIGKKNGVMKSAYSLINTENQEIDLESEGIVYFDDKQSSAFIIEEKDQPYVPFYTEILTAPEDKKSVETLDNIVILFPDVKNVTYTANPAVYIMCGNDSIAPTSVAYTAGSTNKNQFTVNFRQLEKGDYQFFMPMGAFMCGNDTVQADTITIHVTTGYGFQADMSSMLVIADSTEHQNICHTVDVNNLSLYDRDWKTLPSISKNAKVELRPMTTSEWTKDVLATGTLKPGVAYTEVREHSVLTDSGYVSVLYSDTVKVLDIVFDVKFEGNDLHPSTASNGNFIIVVYEAAYGDSNYAKYLAGDTSISKNACHVNKYQELTFRVSYDPSLDPTVIETVSSDNEMTPVIYDLMGRRVKEITKSGIYIVNGKKKYIK